MSSNNKRCEKRNLPAQAITTSSLPAMVLIVATAASLSVLSHDVSLTMCTFPGNCWTSDCKSSAAVGFLAPANTIVLSRRARAVTNPRPGETWVSIWSTLRATHLCLGLHRRQDTLWGALQKGKAGNWITLKAFGLPGVQREMASSLGPGPVVIDE